MDAERAARRLEPLRPELVKRWQRVREAGDSELKALADRRLLAAARRVLGEGRDRVFLSLPPSELIDGPIKLGTVLYERDKWLAGITQAELLQHLAILARSGAGKSNAAFNLLLQLPSQRVPFLFLDWKRTARHLIPELDGKVNLYTPGRALREFPFNPFLAPPGQDAESYADQVIDVLAAAYTLGDGAVNLLQRVLRVCIAEGAGSISLDEVVRRVEALPEGERARGWKISALRALHSLRMTRAVPTAPVSQESLVRTLLKENTIVELDGLSHGGKRFLVPLLLQWVYSVRLAAPDREKLRLVVFLEEAHHYLYGGGRRSGETLIEMLVRQCREVGIAFVIIDQHPHLISSAALQNCYTSLCLSQKDPADVNRAAALSGVDEADKRCFTHLPVGHAVVKLQDRWRRPFVVRIPRVRVRKGAVTDEWLARHANPAHSAALDGTGSRRAQAQADDDWRVRHVREADDPLTPDALRLLEDAVVYPTDGVRARYRRLGFSGQRGHALKNRLVREGWLEAEVIPRGRTRIVALRPSAHARRTMGLSGDHAARESISHAYWKHRYAEMLRALGCEVSIEAALGDGRGDVLAVHDGQRLAVEIETGRSDAAANIRRCLAAGCERVVVVATDPEAMKTVERQVARAGLLIPPRIRLIMAGEVLTLQDAHPPSDELGEHRDSSGI